MKAIAALGLLVAVCIAGAGSASTHAAVTTGRPTPAENERAAKVAAVRLLALFLPPPGAMRVPREPVGDRGFLRRQTFSIGGHSVSRHGFWRVRHRLDSVVAFVKAHPPRGAVRPGGGATSEGPGIPANRSLDFLVQQSRGLRPAHWIEVTMAALPYGSTGIRVDAVAGWIVPRSPREKVPPGVREVDIHSAHRSLRVIELTKVQTVVRWFDALGIVQGGAAYACPALFRGPRVTLDFRSASRALLARARFLAGPVSSECSPIEFSIQGRRQTPLVGFTFWNRLKRFVGFGNRP